MEHEFTPIVEVFAAVVVCVASCAVYLAVRRIIAFVVRDDVRVQTVYSDDGEILERHLVTCKPRKNPFVEPQGKFGP